jgi:hypothetical protein
MGNHYVLGCGNTHTFRKRALVINPIENGSATTIFGKINGNRTKNSLLPNILGYFCAGSARKPPIIGPIMLPMFILSMEISNIGGMIDNTQRPHESSQCAPSCQYRTGTWRKIDTHGIRLKAVGCSFRSGTSSATVVLISDVLADESMEKFTI